MRSPGLPTTPPPLPCWKCWIIDQSLAKLLPKTPLLRFVILAAGEVVTSRRFTSSRWLGALMGALMMVGLTAGKASAQAGDPYSVNQLVEAGNRFFGQVSGNIAAVIEEAISRYGLPNGYILGESIGGALIGGLRYGEGILYTQNVGNYEVYWQGPSIGFDAGADVSSTMMLVYNLPSVEALYTRFFGVNGAAYVVGGVGMTVLTRNDIIIVPIVSGVGARLGLSVGYYKFTTQPTWNPF
jgi:hypothetical protein